MSDATNDIRAWRELLPDWQPTPGALRALDMEPPELVRALRSIARGWSRDDARWDVLLAVLEHTKRTHAHELAEKIRRAYFGNGDPLGRYATTPVTNAMVAADLIDPEVSG